MAKCKVNILTIKEYSLSIWVKLTLKRVWKADAILRILSKGRNIHIKFVSEHTMNEPKFLI